MQKDVLWGWVTRGAAIATIIALVVLLITNGFNSIDDRITRSEARLTARMDQIDSKLDEFINRADARLDDVKQEQARLDGIVTGYIETGGRE